MIIIQLKLIFYTDSSLTNFGKSLEMLIALHSISLNFY